MKWQRLICRTFLGRKRLFEIYPKLKKSPPESHFDPLMMPGERMLLFWLFGTFWPFLGFFGHFWSFLAFLALPFSRYFLIFIFMLWTAYFSETTLRDHAENDEIRHFWSIWGSKIGVTKKNIDFVDPGGPRKKFQKNSSTSDSDRTRRVTSKNMCFYLRRWV